MSRPDPLANAGPVAAQRNVRYILWGALLATTGVYAALILTVLVPGPGVSFDMTMLYVLAGVSVAIAVVSFVVPTRLMGPGLERVAKKAKIEAQADPDAALGYRGQAETAMVIANSDEVLRALYGMTFTAFILELALSESVAIYGVVLRSMGASAMICLPFVAAGALLIILRFPRESRWTAIIEAKLGARFGRG